MRKTIDIDDFLFESLRQMAKDRGITVAGAMEEAVRGVLHKHGHPTSLEEAFRYSLRKFPLNDNAGKHSAKSSR